MTEQTTGDRVKIVRNSLSMTQAEFSESIGISRDALNNIEHWRLKRTPEATLKLICATYNIDYEWITTGNGEMEHHSENNLMDHINDLLEGENESAKAIFRAFASFDERDWETVQKFIDNIKKGEA